MWTYLDFLTALDCEGANLWGIISMNYILHFQLFSKVYFIQILSQNITSQTQTNFVLNAIQTLKFWIDIS